MLINIMVFFQAMFTHDMAESNQREITLQGIEPDILELLINFAYTGRVRITSCNVQALHIGAAFLQLRCICDACSAYLIKRLNAQNVLNIRSYAHAVGADSLVLAADTFINKHFMVVRNSEDFHNLSLEEVADILSRDNLHVPSEEPIFDTILSWVRRENESRGPAMAQLLSIVRLPLLKPHFITDRVASEDLVKNDLRCRDLVDEAKDYHLMPERRPLLQSFRTKPRCCDDSPGMIFAVGGLTNSGDSLSTVETFDPVTLKWSHIEPMSTLRSRVGVAVTERKLYAIGGFNGHERLKTVEVFDPDRRKWSQVASLNNKRSALGASVVLDKVYVCGGYDGISSLSSVECYDPHDDTWVQVTPMLKQRSAAGTAVIDGRIWVMGGHDGMSIFNSVEYFDAEIDQWTMSIPMLSRRCRLGATAVSGKIYVAGGYDGAQFLRTVEMFDPVKSEWTQLPPMNIKRSRVALVANMGRLFAIGGYDGISNLSSMETLDLKDPEAQWKFGPSMIAHEGGVGIGVIPIIPMELC